MSSWINFSQLICLEEEIAGDIVSQDYPLTPAGNIENSLIIITSDYLLQVTIKFLCFRLDRGSNIHKSPRQRKKSPQEGV